MMFIFLFFHFVSAADVEPSLARVEALEDRPYVPQKRDYGLELGAGFEKQSLYSLGLNVGFHLGTCIGTASQTCQQFFDGNIGILGRESRMHWLGLASLRWQFVNFPSPWGPFIRVLVGNTYSIVPERENYSTFTYGAGAGLARYLHPRVDMRFEARALYSERFFSVVLISFQFKVDEWIRFFDEKLEGLSLPKVPVLQD